MEEDIRRHMIEDGEDPDAPLPAFRPVPNVQAIRERLNMSQSRAPLFACQVGEPPCPEYGTRARRQPIGRVMLPAAQDRPQFVPELPQI